MFSPTSLALKPSIPLAMILSTPFISAIMLIALANIPLLLSLSWLLLVGLAWHYFIGRYALLSKPNSTCVLESHGADLFLRECSGKRFSASLAPGAIIHPWWCILSFNCETGVYQETSLAEVSTEDTSGFLNKMKTFFVCRKSSQIRRHIIISRYNVSNMNEYRRMRVVLKLS